MCGIIGIVSQEGVVPSLIESLKRLEYRGYDSAGVATLFNGSIERRRAEGKLSNLVTHLKDAPIDGKIGIGHTRWATHGAPSELNAHPHATDHVAVVHNGIIENFRSLRQKLEAEGVTFETETDTEVVARLISYNLETLGLSPEAATHRALEMLEGAFALAIMFSGHESLMIGARQGSPLVLGYGSQEVYLGSDALALAPLTSTLTYLEEGDWVIIEGQDVKIMNRSGQAVKRELKQSAISGAMIGKGEYRHFMEKEIHEQPAVIGDTLRALYSYKTQSVELPKLPVELEKISRFTASACGTAFYACTVGKYWMEQIARLPMDIDIASEFRYREAPMPKDGAFICVSQSGETIDTLEALRYAKSQDQTILSVVNVPESAIARESHASLQTLAGPEIGVASTKAFSTQLVVLAALVIETAIRRQAITAAKAASLTNALISAPALLAQALANEDKMRSVAAVLAEARDVLYLGRGSSYPIAMEGALKLKEISYIHAEAFAAGEMKHGPIALIDENVPVVVVAPYDNLFEKTASNLHQLVARGGKAILVSDAQGINEAGEYAAHNIEMPACDPFVAPILYSIPMQLLAYFAAVAKGTDVDQPRNLAKSVTVE